MNNNAISQNRRPWFVLIPLLIGAVMASVNLSEWYRVGVIGNIAGYPFVGEGPVPYFYKTPQLYSMVCAIFGSIWFCLSCLSIWSLLKRKRRMGLIASAMIMAAILIEFVNGQIAP
jgi:hypothetical protein